MAPRVAVGIVTYDSARQVEACLGALAAARLEESGARVTVVDNRSTDDTVARVRSGFPEVELIVNERNLGFAGACNLVLRAAIDGDTEFVYLLNPDTRVEPGFLSRALEVARGSDRIAAVQSLVLLAPDGARIDTAGNALHCLGFGYCAGHRRPRAEAPSAPVEVAFASGAGVLLRTAALAEVGLLDESLFLYCEDLDLGWRLRRAGWSIVLAPDSIVLHDHEFARHPDKYFLLERNRWLVLLRNWSARSLLVLAGPLLAAELALLAIAARRGWLGAKLRSYRDLARRETWRRLRAARREDAPRRRVPDRDLAAAMTARMEVDGGETPLLGRFANPLLAAVWAIARRLL
jgi:hypothetical protein